MPHADILPFVYCAQRTSLIRRREAGPCAGLQQLRKLGMPSLAMHAGEAKCAFTNTIREPLASYILISPLNVLTGQQSKIHKTKQLRKGGAGNYPGDRFYTKYKNNPVILVTDRKLKHKEPYLLKPEHSQRTGQREETVKKKKKGTSLVSFLEISDKTRSATGSSVLLWQHRNVIHLFE